jgi:carbamoyl-phosphate synthase large subunit
MIHLKVQSLNKINVLITSAGRRTKLVEYFKKELHGIGNVITADCSPLAPALYTSDKGYVIPPITDSGYLEKIMDICSKENISAILSLIDPELLLLAENRKVFEDMGIKVILSGYSAVDMCYDKIKMRNFLDHHDFDKIKTYDGLTGFLDAYNHGRATFPVFVKERFGSASAGAAEIHSMESLKVVLSENRGLLVQDLIEGRELGIDIYVDLISREIISIFIKEKIYMRSGETDKAVSVINPAIVCLAAEFVTKLDLVGPLDMDIIEKDRRYYIIDVNCRFGGGYPLAYECGENYPLYIINNIQGRENVARIGQYPEGVKMMKHDDVVIIRP